MRLNREITVRCLNTVALAYALHLLRHQMLLVVTANVLNDRVRKDNIELVIVEVIHITRITGYTDDAGIEDISFGTIVGDNLYILVVKRHALPELLRASYIKNTQWSRQYGNQRDEEIEAPATYACL